MNEPNESDAMLDWMEANKAEIDFDGPGVVIYTDAKPFGVGASGGAHPTLRQAIRAAMRPAPTTP